METSDVYQPVADLPKMKEGYLGEPNLTIITRQYPNMINLFNRTYQCLNCGLSFSLKSLGSWQCRYHPGVLKANRWSCCQQQYENHGRSSGCKPADHHLDVHTMHGIQKPIRIPKAILDIFDITIPPERYTESEEMDRRSLRRLLILSVHQAEPVKE